MTTELPKSTQKLVAALTEAKAPEWLIEMARKNEFHDFLTASATPMHDLILHAHAAGLSTIVEAVHRGDFDAGPDDDRTITKEEALALVKQWKEQWPEISELFRGVKA